MNRRQKKKAFKKKYGMNPKEYEAWKKKLEMFTPEFREKMIKLSESVSKSMEEFAEAFGEAVLAAARSFKESIYREEIGDANIVDGDQMDGDDNTSIVHAHDNGDHDSLLGNGNKNIVGEER